MSRLGDAARVYDPQPQTTASIRLLGVWRAVGCGFEPTGPSNLKPRRRWLRFLVGLAVLLGFAFVLSRGLTPAGPLGEVWRRNLRHGVDATPLFYTEVERSLHFEYRDLFLVPPQSGSP